jgi:hypothetical protein
LPSIFGSSGDDEHPAAASAATATAQADANRIQRITLNQPP